MNVNPNFGSAYQVLFKRADGSSLPQEERKLQIQVLREQYRAQGRSVASFSETDYYSAIMQRFNALNAGKEMPENVDTTTHYLLVDDAHGNEATQFWQEQFTFSSCSESSTDESRFVSDVIDLPDYNNPAFQRFSQFKQKIMAQAKETKPLEISLNGEGPLPLLNVQA